MPKTLVNSTLDSCQPNRKNKANIRREQTKKNKSNLHLYEKVARPGNLYAPRGTFGDQQAHKMQKKKIVISNN